MPVIRRWPCLWFPVALLLLAPWALKSEGAEQEKGMNLAGTYRNLSFNVDGAGGAQRNMAPLVLFPGGSYTWGKEEGRWSVREGRLALSGRPAWGEAAVNKDRQLIFEFTREGKRFAITMYRAGEVPGGGAAPGPPESKK